MVRLRLWIALLLTLAALTPGLARAQSETAALFCSFRGGTFPATINAVAGVPTIGTSGNDVIRGTNGVDVIDGFGGDDIICGRGGTIRSTETPALTGSPVIPAMI